MAEKVDSADFFSQVYVPQLDLGGGARGGQLASPGQADARGGYLELPQFLAGCHIPLSNGVIRGKGGQNLSVRRNSQAMDVAMMPAAGRHDFLAGIHFPQADRVAGSALRQRFAVGRKGEVRPAPRAGKANGQPGRELGFNTAQAAEFLAAFYIPQVNGGTVNLPGGHDLAVG